MAKHNIEKTKKDLLGQYMTTNADVLLENYKGLVLDRVVLDPCEGHGDLTNWAWKNGATDIEGYDIEPVLDHTEYRDLYSTDQPLPDYSGKLIVTNPPYLSSNRSDDKTVFDTWKQNDLYKCYLATLSYHNVDEAIIIQPSNFLFESRSGAREMLFENYNIKQAEYWEHPVFDDAVIGIMTMHIQKKDFPQIGQDQNFTIINRTKDISTDVTLEARYNYLDGKEFFDYIRNAPRHSFERVHEGMDPPNSNIVLSIMEGTHGICLLYNDAEPIYTPEKSFTTYQINLPFELSEAEQREAVNEFNKILNGYRKQYDSRFLSNYIAAEQKILSRDYANKLLAKILLKHFYEI